MTGHLEQMKHFITLFMHVPLNSFTTIVRVCTNNVALIMVDMGLDFSFLISNCGDDVEYASSKVHGELGPIYQEFQSSVKGAMECLLLSTVHGCQIDLGSGPAHPLNGTFEGGAP